MVAVYVLDAPAAADLDSPVSHDHCVTTFGIRAGRAEWLDSVADTLLSVTEPAVPVFPIAIEVPRAVVHEDHRRLARIFILV